jgi:MOSC domain-containing protein YiiM
MTTAPARLLHVCTARAQLHQINDQPVLSAIAKRPVDGLVRVGPLGLAGDEQADPGVHGGLSKAVYAYPSEHLPFWQTVRAQAAVAAWGAPQQPGLLGENLLLQGVLEEALWIGDLLHIGGPSHGGCVLAVSEPRFPCFKFNHAMGFKQAARLMQQSESIESIRGSVSEGQVSPLSSLSTRRMTRLTWATDSPQIKASPGMVCQLAL